MSSTGAGRDSGCTAGFVLTGASLLPPSLGSRLVGLEHLSERYAEHNRLERGAGFVFAGSERVELFRRYVGGPGRRFLAGRKPEDDPTRLQMFSAEDVRTLLAGFEDPQLHFIAGRLVPLHARLFANDIVFAGRKPR